MTMGFAEAIRVLNDNKNMIIGIDDRNQLREYLNIIHEFDLQFYQLIGEKTNTTPFNNVYLKDKECALYVYKHVQDYDKTFEGRKTITHFGNNSGSGQNKNFVSGHPTPKPLNIIQKYINKHTKEGDLVLDLFSGSGTTAVACAQMGRRYIAFELVEKGYKKSLERLRTEGQQMTGIK